MNFDVVAVCLSAERGEQKHPVEKAEFKPRWGIVGDGHAGSWHRQISIIAEEATGPALERAGKRNPVPYTGPGAFGENILTRGMDWREAKVGARVRIGDVVLEITQLGKAFHEENAIYRITGEVVLPEHGVFAKVLEGGTIHAGLGGHYDL